ncbi:MAG: zf-TFIIB domain-containing protein [Acidobacteria bacterium]|nr:zf-TFIIB domain-containing protein [Acidobacteriota bacterium]
MRCPLCSISLKAASHRGIALSYCPVCGGTWLDRERYGDVGSAAARHHGHRRPARAAAVAGLAIAVCLLVALAAGAVKFWPVVSGWVRTLAGGNGELISRIGRTDGGALAQTVTTALSAKAGYGALIGSVAAISGLGALVESGAYLAVLKEAQRQGAGNLADLKTESIAAAEVRAAAEQIQGALRAAPAAAAAGVVDPAVVNLLESREFQLVRASGLLGRLLNPAASREQAPVD